LNSRLPSTIEDINYTTMIFLGLTKHTNMKQDTSQSNTTLEYIRRQYALF
jgi:hypothetical protein